MPCAETSSPSFGRALSDVGNARLMTTSKPACRSAAKSSGSGMPLVASRSSMRRKLRMCSSLFTVKEIKAGVQTVRYGATFMLKVAASAR